MTGWLAADALNSPVITAAVAAIIGLFGGGGLVALLRMPADRGKVVIDAAQGAVVVQSGVIDALQEEIARLRLENTQQADRFTQQISGLQAQNAEQAARLAVLEQTGHP